MKLKTVSLMILMGALLMGVLSTTNAAPPSQMEDGQEYIVQADDWLSKLADKFYGDILAYQAIVDATNAMAAEDDSYLVIDNPDLIEVGQKLWIPNADGMMEESTAETSEESAEEMSEETVTEETATESEEAMAEEEMTSSATIYALSGEGVFPEGVAYNEVSGKFYVGSTGDGTLYEGDVATGEVTIFSEGGADGRTTAIGMKVDGNGMLWVAGGPTGQIFVYNTADGSLVATYTTPEVEQTFLNDVVIAPDGSAYVTDSFRPVLFKVSGTEGGEAESWLDFTGSVLEYEEGFNLNGIVSSPDGNYLLAVHYNTGNLYRIDVATQEVSLVDTGGAELTAGDGLLLIDETLYVARNQFGEIVPLAMSDAYMVGIAGESFTDSSLIFPTTIAQVGDTLLVVNSQFNNQGGTPVLPFTVSQIPLP